MNRKAVCSIHFNGRVRGELTDVCNDASGIRNERPKFLAMPLTFIGIYAVAALIYYFFSFLLLKMESTNHGEGPVAASKRRYIPLNDVLPPLETLVVTIEESVDPDGVCCLSIPNRVLGDWANNREKNTSFVALASEYIVDEAITLNPCRSSALRGFTLS